MDNMQVPSGAVDEDPSADLDSNSTEDGSFADADGDGSSIGGTTARHSSTATLSRDKAKSLSRLPFADKQQLVREMFARREQAGKSPHAIPRDNAGTLTSELDADDDLSSNARGPAKKLKRRGIPLPGLGAMDEDDQLPALQASRARPHARKSMRKREADMDHHDTDEADTRSRSVSPPRTRGKRIPLKSGDEPTSQTLSGNAQKSSKSPTKATADHHRESSEVQRNTHQSSNGGQSITIRLPANAHLPHPSCAPSVVAPPLTSLWPYPALSNASDKLFLRQTVSSFEQCLHHALDLNTALLAQVTKQQLHPPASFMPNIIAPAPHATSPSSIRSPQRPPTYPCSIPDSQPQPAKRAVEYAQGLHKIKEMIGQVQATTARHAKAMDTMVQAVNAEREKRAADEFKGLMAQLTDSVGYSASGNGRSR